MLDLKKGIITLMFTLSLCAGVIIGSAYPDSAAEYSDMKIDMGPQADSIAHVDYQRVEHSSAPPVYIPNPSPILLFSMGLLGVLCVIINERKKKPQGL